MPRNPVATARVSVEAVAFSRDAQNKALVCACAVGLAFSCNYTNHAPLAGALARQFGLDQTHVGLLTTGIFATHAAMQIPGGHLVDRFHARVILIAALAWVIVGNVGISLAGAYWQLLAWKIFTGIGTGTCFVAGARYTHEALAGHRLHLAQGMYGGSIVLGSGFVILAVPRIYAALGWRAAFLSSGAIATLALALWIIVAPRVPGVPRLRVSFWRMLGAPQLWLLGLMQMASFGVAIVVGAWIVSLLEKTFGMPLAKAGMVGSLVLLLGIGTRPLGGALRRRAPVRVLLIASFLANALGCWLLASGNRSILLAFSAMLLLGTGCGLPYAALFTRAAALYPARAASAMGLVNMLGIVMILAGAPLMGHLADWTGSLQSSFLALGAFSLVTCAAVFLIDRDEPSPSV